MRINEIITEDTTPIDEAVYNGNLGITEFMEFVEMADDNLIEYVDKLINEGQNKEVWKVIQQFLGVNLKGPQFSVEESKNLSEVDDKAAQIMKLRRDFQKLQMSPGMGGKDMAEVMKKRKAKLKAQIAAIQAGGAAPTAPMANKPSAKRPVRKLAKGQNPDGSFSIEGVKETATAGATSAGNIASVPNANEYSPGKSKNVAAGKPGKMGKSPAQPKPKKQKPTDNALDMKNTNIFGGKAIKR